MKLIIERLDEMEQDIHTFSLTFCPERWVEKLSQQSYFISSFCVAEEVRQ